MNNTREHFASRIGFIFAAAGCAIGLGNIWRFPYIAGQYGGALFVLLYIVCLLLFGIPLLLMELSVGRAGQSTFPGAFKALQNPASKFKWHLPVYVLFTGNMILLMFYTVITGWLLYYACKFISFDTSVFDGTCFKRLQAAPGTQSAYMLATLAVTLLICLGGVQKTIEKSIKIMMAGLFLLLLVLVCQALRHPGASAGVKFFLQPDFSTFAGKSFIETFHAAMSQAFFTLSIGIGSIAVFGSYLDRTRSLFQEGLWIILLDTAVAISAGLIIFPSCMAYGVDAGEGPALIFITLPKVFQNMSFGMFWGALFFIFLVVAALSTLVAVFENITAFGIDEFKWSRKRSVLIFGILLALLSLPCIFGFNLWQHIHPLGGNSTILELEDFIVSANLLPLGGIYLTVFCMSRYGWGAENCFNELNSGKGLKFPVWMKNYIKFVIPVLVIFLWITGIWKILS